MKRRSLLQVLGLAGAGTLLSGCEYVFGRDWAFNEKLSLVVSTPTGDKTGVAVTHWQMSKSPGMFYSLGGLGGNQTGEAAVIDLGEGKLLFALLGKPDPVLGLYQKNQVADGLEDALDEMTSKKISSAVPADQYPLLVTFDNIADPKSVKQVKPSDLAATFGAGYSLKRITLEITDEKVTEGVVEKVLGWLYEPKYRNNPIWASLPDLTQKTISGLKQPLSANSLGAKP